jgi:hypothetical protein
VRAVSVVRLHELRTVTISCDLAFRRRALTVLEPLGPTAFGICSLARGDAVLDILRRQRAAVAVLDVTLAPARLLDLVAELVELAPDLGVVAVADFEPAVSLGLPVLPKWGWASDLVAAVQSADRAGNPLQRQPTVLAGEGA